MFENEPDLPFTHKGIRILFFLSLTFIFISLVYKNRDYIKNIGIKDSNMPKKYSVDKLDIDKSALNYDYEIDKKPSLVKPITIQKDKDKLISAESYILGNLDSGVIYIKSNENKVFPIASISKLIVALVAIHNIDVNKKITINEDMLKAYGNAGNLVVGEVYTIRELLYPLLLESSNDAAEAIAQSFTGGYNSFLYQMNSFVNELGMNSTSFKDASGLSSGNISNASDLFILSRYIYNNEKDLLALTKNYTVSLASTTEHAGHTYKAIDPFVLDPNFIGGKTGRTIEAKESMLSLFNYSLNSSMKLPISVIVLRSDFSSREIDTSILFEQFMKMNMSI